MHMLLRILTEEIESISDEEIRQVCMLVVYHDIIGDCMEKVREKQQVADVIDLRGERVVNGFRLNDYIPFYLGPRSLMLYVIQHGYNGVKRVEPEKIVYCVVRLDDMVKDDINCIFTDGHALSALTSYYTKDKLPQIDRIVRYEDVYSTQWNIEEDIDLKRRKEAELLLNCDLAPQYIRGYVVYNNEAKEQLVGMGIAVETIVVARNYYF